MPPDARKADFSAIYTRPGPREYFATLMPLDYRIPQRALPLVEAVWAAAGRPSTVLDVCCSYGINAALLRHTVDLDEIAVRAVDPRAGDDAAFYRGRLRRPALSVIGLDVSKPAIDYAVRTGLLAAGWAEDLEAADPSPALAASLRGVGMIVCTGGVGYVGERTFERILGAVDDPGGLWLAVVVLRMFDYTPIAATLSRHGLVTERVPGVTLRQRRFVDRAEHEAAVHHVRSRGLNPRGKESEGWFHADCWITRPSDAPLPDLPA